MAEFDHDESVFVGGVHWVGDAATGMRTDDVVSFRTLVYTWELSQGDKFACFGVLDVEEAQDPASRAGWACVCAYREDVAFVVVVVHVHCPADDTGAEDHGCAVGCWSGHLVEHGEVVFAWFVCDVDWAARDAARGGVEGGVGVRGLEHVPVWEDVKEAG